MLFKVLNLTLFPVKIEMRNAIIQTVDSTLQDFNLKAAFTARLREKFFNFAAAFRKFDQNRDGFIDLNEFHKGVYNLGLMYTHRERIELFTAIDLHRKGKVDFSEFSELLDEPGCSPKFVLPRLYKLNLRKSQEEPTRFNETFNESFEAALSSITPKKSQGLRSTSVKPFRLASLRAY